MSLYELMICDKSRGGCGHARHRHTKAPGNTWRTFSGACRVQGCDGHCPCPKFVKSKNTNEGVKDVMA